MKVAVTGASGFLGRHVLDVLSRTPGLTVVAASRRAELAWVPAGMSGVSLDIATCGTGGFDLLGQPDILIHLAWSGLPNYASHHHFEEQLPLQYRFLQQMARAGLQSLLCAGTCFEYGMRSGELDEALPTDPRNAYGFAKDALRRQLEFMSAEHGLQLTWARLFYMHGQGQAASSLYGQFTAAGASGLSEFRMSGGEQLRDYLHVSEVAQRLVDLALRAPGAGVVNVCSGRPVSVRSLVEGWLLTHPWPMELVLGHYPYSAYEPMAFWGSNAKLNQLLGAT